MRDFGIYHFRPSRLAFRNDYCLYCKCERRAEQLRTFLVGHILGVPILPLGFHARWYCVECRRDPHESPTAKPQLKWAAILFLLMFAAVAWVEPVTQDFVAGTWIMRVGCPLGILLLVYTMVRKRKDASLDQLLAQVHPASDTDCPFCEIPLLVGSTTSCPECGALRL